MYHALVGAAAIATMAWSAPAFAHAHLEASTIADGAQVAAAPAEMALTFDEPVALAGVTLTAEGGAEIPIDFTPSREEAATHAMEMPSLEPGGYAFTWRALGDDGHVMTETIAFTVTGAEGADGGAPMHFTDETAHMHADDDAGHMDTDSDAEHMHSDDAHGHDDGR
jgi:methionine-rich copper-binding protein CopC